VAPDRTFAIVGAGLAGARAAAALREEGFDGRIVLLGEEPERPYVRPPLSKGYLAGRTERKDVYVHAEGFYAEHAIELRTSTPVETIDRAATEVVLAGGERLRYDRLLLATGAAPRSLPVPGGDLDGVLVLRRVEDSDAIRERIDRGDRIVVVGGGWIGAEVAATARSRGCEVALVYPTSAPLEHVLGPEVARAFSDLHAAHGVELHPGAKVAALEGDGSVGRVRLEDGGALEADAVVVGIGVVPRVELAERAGLPIENGVAVDARLRTSDDRVLAAGDIAAVAHPFFGRRIRVEHWAVAREHGPFAARSMLGSDDAYESLPYFFTDQYGATLEYWGLALEWDEVVLRGDPAGGRFLAFWLADGRVLAGAGFDSPGVGDAIQALIRSREQVDRAALADPGTPLPGSPPEGLPELAPGEGVVVERGEDSVAVARDAAGRLHAVSAVCTHVGCIVGWNAEEGTWDCPCHGSRFAIGGEVLHGPAVEPLPPASV
jgi:3-phenylpropionate/trans-cinnamate dioxygenase ferredoxin reductase subunit